MCHFVWENVPYVAQKLNWVNSTDTCSLNVSTTCTFQTEDAFKIVDFIPKLLLTNDGIAKLIYLKKIALSSETAFNRK